MPNISGQDDYGNQPTRHSGPCSSKAWKVFSFWFCLGINSKSTTYLDWIVRSRSLCRTSKPAWRCSRSTPTPSQRYPHLCDLCLGLKEEHFYSKCVLSVPYCWVQSHDNKKIKHYLLFSQHGEIDFEAVVKLSDG